MPRVVELLPLTQVIALLVIHADQGSSGVRVEQSQLTTDMSSHPRSNSLGRPSAGRMRGLVGGWVVPFRRMLCFDDELTQMAMVYRVAVKRYRAS